MHAVAQRWTEEYNLVQEEMKRTYRFFLWFKHDWLAISLDAETTGDEGAAASCDGACGDFSTRHSFEVNIDSMACFKHR